MAVDLDQLPITEPVDMESRMQVELGPSTVALSTWAVLPQTLLTDGVSDNPSPELRVAGKTLGQEEIAVSLNHDSRPRVRGDGDSQTRRRDL